MGTRLQLQLLFIYIAHLIATFIAQSASQLTQDSKTFIYKSMCESRPYSLRHAPHIKNKMCTV